jgi:hypothetical protein
LLHFVANPKRFQMQPSFFNFFDPDCGHNLFALNDLGPMVGFFLSCGRYLFDPDKWLHLARMEKLAGRIGKLLHRNPQAASSITLDHLVEPNFDETFQPSQDELDELQARADRTEIGNWR